jgi:acyl-CoA synthetase (AMP-forming)/AMP-acid ligase II/uncharacterized membrane protein
MRVSGELTIDAPVAAVWELIGDPLLYPRFLRDITRWDPVSGDVGVRPRYRIEVRVGAVELGAIVEVMHVSAPNELSWESVSGIEHRGRWRLEEDGDHRCSVMFELHYRSPGGVLGRIADGAALPLLRQGVGESLARLKAELEGRPPARGRLARIARSAGDAAYDARVLARLGLLAPARPDRLLRAAWELLRWDATLAAGCTIGAALHPGDRALVDENGEWTFAEVHRRTNSLARGLQQAGVEPGARVAMLCRNHAGFAEAILAASKLGADVLLLNTGLAAPQLREVLRRERPQALIHDDEFLEGVKIRGLRRFVAWHDDRASASTLEELIAGSDPRALPPPSRHGHLVILTSGTTGAPKAAARRESDSLGTPLALLGRIPLRARGVTYIASPLFHSWGYLHFGLASAVSATLVLRRSFDPEALLATVARDRVDTLVVVPTMLARILELPHATRRRYDTSSLRVVVVSGSALHGDLATRFMREFGEILYNLYGSTEVSWAAIATPADLRAAPGTVGRPPRGTRVVIFDELGRRLPAGSRGRIFVGNETAFDGYTDGGGKQLIDGLLSTGDIGHIDDAGRLFVDGREDDMIVSGGENIFPSEVENALALHPGVAEVAVVGVEDERFGQRLKAYVVAADDAAASEEELKQMVRARLAPFKVPREIEFVSELPHTESGKLTKVGLDGPRP